MIQDETCSLTAARLSKLTVCKCFGRDVKEKRHAIYAACIEHLPSLVEQPLCEEGTAYGVKGAGSAARVQAAPIEAELLHSTLESAAVADCPFQRPNQTDHAYATHLKSEENSPSNKRNSSVCFAHSRASLKHIRGISHGRKVQQ